jgi:hypothetical protein
LAIIFILKILKNLGQEAISCTEEDILAVLLVVFEVLKTVSVKRAVVFFVD